MLAALGVALVAVLAWVLGPGAAWVLEHFDGVRGLAGKDLAAALDAIRGRALAIATGLIALVAVYYTARNADTARQGHITDRYTKAIEQLGSDKLDIRLGGIYALERIARDSARDHPTVMEVLVTFVREHSRDAETDEAGEVRPRGPELRTDLQAALTVIGRRTVTHDIPHTRINLTGAHLAGANLIRAHLTDADLTGATLTSARLDRANLTGATLFGVNLTGANLFGATLANTRLEDASLDAAILTEANFTRAYLTDANLTRANLTGANLTEAFLARADLTDANLYRADFTGANLTDAVGWPPP
ncbi:pentapeptide repeat-containing protein [Streptosporangium sp. NPDC050855]|uniref:pentapeptide repeat-containing protein n=1 Tax=Streptosporangium sp. NPDC050855 TaxID=3366194 RepID=UPI00378D82B6